MTDSKGWPEFARAMLRLGGSAIRLTKGAWTHDGNRIEIRLPAGHRLAGGRRAARREEVIGAVRRAFGPDTTLEVRAGRNHAAWIVST